MIPRTVSFLQFFFELIRWWIGTWVHCKEEAQAIEDSKLFVSQSGMSYLLSCSGSGETWNLAQRRR